MSEKRYINNICFYVNVVIVKVDFSGFLDNRKRIIKDWIKDSKILLIRRDYIKFYSIVRRVEFIVFFIYFIKYNIIVYIL